MMTTATECLLTHLPDLIRSGLWLGVAWMMLCRLRKLGPESRKLLNASLSMAGAGALGEALAIVVPWSARQAAALELLAVGGLFGLLLVFSSEWADGAPAVTRRR